MRDEATRPALRSFGTAASGGPHSPLGQIVFSQVAEELAVTVGLLLDPTVPLPGRKIG